MASVKGKSINKDRNWITGGLEGAGGVDYTGGLWARQTFPY